MSIGDRGKKALSVGPWGGQDGFLWDDGVRSGIRQLVIAHGAGIDSIQIQYDDNGTSVWSEKHGGSGGPKTDKVKLEYPEEFITSIHGHYGYLNEWGPVYLRSLTFESNRKTYGPYGIEQGTYFSFPMNGGKIVGFHGKSSWYLDAIGAYLEPLSIKPNPSTATVQSQHYYVTSDTTDGRLGYSVVQGTLGSSYDVILAFRQKSDCSFSPDFQDFSDSVSKQKKLSQSSVPASIERIPSKTVTGFVTYGTWGGTGGTVFDDGIYTGIRQIQLSRNVGIVYMRVLYDQNGETIWGGKNGGTGGFKSDKITFDYPYEVLTHITGFYGPTMVMGPIIIKSLTFHTTKMRYGPYGEEQGQQFSTNVREGKIVGFHGRKGLFLDAIGVHVVEGKVILPTCPPNTNPSIQAAAQVPVTEEPQSPRWSSKLGLVKRGLPEELGQRVVKEPALGGTGPWGGDGGRPWDDGVFSGIKQIYLTRKEAICSIQIEYDRNGQSVWSIKHGGNGSDDGVAITIPIKLEYPDEVLTCISGFYGPVGGEHGPKVMKSLTLTTSRRKMGPYGEEKGTFFTSVTTEGKVMGFHGRSSMYLDAIGVHMQHWLGRNHRQLKSSLMKIFS